MLESFNWLMNIIDSCNNHFQMECCTTLVDLFRRMYVQEDEYGALYDKLMDSLVAKDTSLTV